MHYLLPMFKWFDASAVGLWIRDSRWIFPAIEAVHIVALALLFGAVLMLNLRLMGLTLTNKSMSQLARDLSPWVTVSLLIILTTGVMLFSSEAMKSYASVPFKVKMVLLFAAMIFHFSVFSRITNTDFAAVHKVWSKLAAVVSILLWLGVGIAGRGIGFL
jgi:Family of unknown function (DUF6644)